MRIVDACACGCLCDGICRKTHLNRQGRTDNKGKPVVKCQSFYRKTIKDKADKKREKEDWRSRDRN